MNAYVMIEGTRVYPDAAPVASFEKDASFRRKATNGSKRLRNAILKAKGLPIPHEPRKIEKRAEVTVCPCCASQVNRTVVTPKRLLVSEIQRVVAEHYGLPVETMTSNQQYHKVAHPRQLAMFLANELTMTTLADIGRRFKRDHTTVMYALKAVRDRITYDPDVAADLEILREKLSA